MAAPRGVAVSPSVATVSPLSHKKSHKTDLHHGNHHSNHGDQDDHIGIIGSYDQNVNIWNP